MSVVATVGTVSKTVVAKAVVSVVGISSSLSLRGSGGLGVSRPLAVVSVVAISLGLGLINSGGLGVSGPLAVVSVVSVGVGVAVSVGTESVSKTVVAEAVVSVVGIGISLRLGVSQSEGNKASPMRSFIMVVPSPSARRRIPM